MIRKTTPPLLFLVVVSSAPLITSAQEESKRDREKERVIIAKLEAIAPQSVSRFESATRALDGGDYGRAAMEYREVLEEAPNFDPALRRLGGAYVELGHHEKGIALLERAVTIERSPANLISLAYGLVNPEQDDGEASREDLTRANALAIEAAQLDPEDPDLFVLPAQIALTLEEKSEFNEVVDVMLENHPGYMPTHYFAAIRAAINEDWLEAERQILEAGRLGLPQETVDEFLGTGGEQSTTVWWWANLTGAATLLWASGLLVLFVVGNVLSSVTLASVERDDPNGAVAGATKRLRACYRWVVNVAGIYWYLSLPFVALVVVALTASVLYAFFTIGRIPIKLAIIIVIGALVSLFAIVRSLFVRIRDDQDPGRAITEADAPALWAMAKDVAAKVDTRPVDEIWLTPGTELAVFERGGKRARMSDSARRALLLGAGVLDGFGQSAFQAVLAHEYGHFSHRDTAGGDVALRVQNGMYNFAVALAEAGYAVWWNVAFQFLRIYDFLFRRISHGATRLQEVLADRVAIQRFGFDAFKQGLTHVIRRSIVFGHTVDSEIKDAIQSQRPLANLYSLPEPKFGDAVETISQEIASALGQNTTEDDTHPSPKDRFRLGERIAGPAPGLSTGVVWDLFDDRERLMAELTAEVAERVTEGSGVNVTTFQPQPS